MESARNLLLYPLSPSQENLVPGWVVGGTVLAEPWRTVDWFRSSW
jgi:hypothetical protein